LIESVIADNLNLRGMQMAVRLCDPKRPADELMSTHEHCSNPKPCAPKIQ